VIEPKLQEILAQQLELKREYERVRQYELANAAMKASDARWLTWQSGATSSLGGYGIPLGSMWGDTADALRYDTRGWVAEKRKSPIDKEIEQLIQRVESFTLLGD